MVDWYYAEGGDPYGPHSDEDIRSLILVGKLNADSLLWQEGLPAWSKMRDVPEFASSLPKASPPPIPVAPPPIPQLEAVGAAVNPQPAAPASDGWEVGPPDPPSEPASTSVFVGNKKGYLHAQGGPWSRYFARQFDLILWGIALAFVIELTLPTIHLNTYLQYSQGNTFAVGLILIAGASLINGVVAGLFGRSLGKAMFGLRVMPVDGREKFNMAEHIAREFRVWFAGLAVGIPIIALFTMWKNFSEVSVGRPATYDRQFAKIEVTHIGTFRRAAAMLFAALVVFGAAALGAWGDVQADRELLTPATWTNPVTGRSTRIDGYVAAPMTLDDGSIMYTFQFGASVIAYLADETDATGTLTMPQYVEAMRAALVDVDHAGPAMPVNIDGVTMQKWEGVLRSQGWPGAYFVFKEGTRFWRIIVFRPGATNQVDEESMPIVIALKRSVLP